MIIDFFEVFLFIPLGWYWWLLVWLVIWLIWRPDKLSQTYNPRSQTPDIYQGIRLIMIEREYWFLRQFNSVNVPWKYPTAALGVKFSFLKLLRHFTSRNSSLSTAIMNSSLLSTRLASLSASPLLLGRVLTRLANYSVLSSFSCDLLTSLCSFEYFRVIFDHFSGHSVSADPRRTN